MTTSPFPILQTTRLTLREVKPLDAPSLLTYLADERVVKPIGLAPFQTEADALDEINWYHAIRTEQTGLRWGITEHATPDIIGSCGFLNRSSRHQRAELGFELSPAHWGKGLAQEAVRAVLAHGFNE
ncbi:MULTISPECIES: GNAT family N-acetyltransferase [unclassified Exiguobacterium]